MVTTDGGEIETGVVVCAAGVWSPALARMVGVDLPVQPVLREVGFTGPVMGLPRRIPLTVDFSTGFYFHREGPRAALRHGRSCATAGTRRADRPGVARARLGGRRTSPADAPGHGPCRRLEGAYEVTPDHNALVGEAQDVSRFLYATGFSGHGFLQGPAVGEIVRDLVLGRRPFVDVSPLAVERFALAAPRPEHNVI